MDRVTAVATLSRLSRPHCGTFRGRDAERLGIERHQLASLCHAGIVDRELPDTYRMTSVPRSDEQRLRAALLWAGPGAAGHGRSAAWWYGLQGIRAPRPELVTVGTAHHRHANVAVRRVKDPAPLMIRLHRGLRVTGVESTLVRLAHLLDGERLEVAFEDARRQQLTSTTAMRAYLDRYARPGHRGVGTIRNLLAELDPLHPSRSDLEVKARRLLVAHGITHFVREHPLGGASRTYFFDFAFLPERTILETNGRRWHDDPTDYEYDNEKWSVPGRHGFKLVLATWPKVTTAPDALVTELRATLGA